MTTEYFLIVKVGLLLKQIKSDYCHEITLIVCYLRGLDVQMWQKSPNLAQMTFGESLSNPDIGHTFLHMITLPN